MSAFPARFAEKEEQREEAARLAEAARTVGQPALLKAVMSSIPRGVQWRLEVNEGVFKMLPVLQDTQPRPGRVPLPFGPSPFPGEILCSTRARLLSR